MTGSMACTCSTLFRWSSPLVAGRSDGWPGGVQVPGQVTRLVGAVPVRSRSFTRASLRLERGRRIGPVEHHPQFGGPRQEPRCWVALCPWSRLPVVHWSRSMACQARVPRSGAPSRSGNSGPVFPRSSAAFSRKAFMSLLRWGRLRAVRANLGTARPTCRTRRGPRRWFRRRAIGVGRVLVGLFP